MLDFIMISTRTARRGVIEIYPKFLLKNSKDLMIRGGDFYAIWMEERNLWSTDEQDALQLIDRELDLYAEENRNNFDFDVKILHMWDSENGMIDRWHKYCQRQMRDSFHMLDENIIFSNTETTKSDYASKKLNYPLEKCDTPAYDKLMSTLYSEDERRKIEWAIGSVVTGESKWIQKFMVFYGEAGTGKSTVLNIIQQLFEGYYAVFDAKALGSSSNAFALEAFKGNPLVAIQHDGDLSRIEDNSRLNSLISHEMMTVNEKFRSTYSNRFKCFLFMGTNKPVKITDAKSGLIRRLIDVSPSGKRLSEKEYNRVVKQIKFELSGIAYHCQEVYLENKDLYNNYIPVTMLGASNDFYNFVLDSYYVFKKEDGVTLKAAWEMYKTYCDEAKVAYPYSQRVFKEELKNYFKEWYERYTLEDGTRVRNYYIFFRTDKFEENIIEVNKDESVEWLKFKKIKSKFDKECAECSAQYASANETPMKKWSEVKTVLSDLDTSKLHYVKVPENHIVIDFDIPDEDSKKSLKKNTEEASKWPETYAELSKSGSGIHLHYIYTGDVSQLKRVYSDHIEVKVFSGKSSLRRQLTKCNSLPISKISSGLPLKGEKKVVNVNAVKSEQGLRRQIIKAMNKEYNPNTKPSMDLIYKALEDAYNSDLKYDVSDMESAIFAFAAGSTNQSKYCIKLIDKMHFKSKDQEESVSNEEAPMVFFDMEVFCNLFIVCWKFAGEKKPIVQMINPKPADIEDLMRFRLIGFNCRRYDNHILYARLMGYDNEQLYSLSQKIINGNSKSCFFGEAYNISYTDIYDFASSGNKKGLKKLEIEMGIHHQELGLPWDEPIAEDLWEKAAEYCENDVIATEAAFHYLNADWTARQILADLASMTVNDTTNTLTTRIIFGQDKRPQDQFNYRDLSGGTSEVSDDEIENYTAFVNGKPIFPGYIFDAGKSIYRGEEVGEGGYVYAEPGMYGNVAVLDVASMHPSSIIAEELFGPLYTARFKELMDARLAIKHEDFDSAKDMLNGKLTDYIQKVIDGEMTSKDLTNALKTAINSVYGLTAAKFDNAFKDNRNKDNIVAKRGALFMVNLKHEVQKRGFTVAHIKTDSIKIPDANQEIIDFVFDYGKMYGYNFEHETTYDRMCLVNDAVLIAKDTKGNWKAVGKQFAVPYVYKTLFSKEEIIFEDLCEVKSVSTALYLDINEELPDVTEYETELSKIETAYKKGLMSDTDFEPQAMELVKEIEKGHEYRFVGNVGQFTPILPGKGGGILLRKGTNGKYNAVEGTKGYRWMESEIVKKFNKEGDVDLSYYESLVDGAIQAIVPYGDFSWFVSDDAYIGPYYEEGEFMNRPVYEDELPFN